MRLTRSRAVVAGLAVALAAGAAEIPAAQARTLIQPSSAAGIAGWTETGSSGHSVLTAGEGVATVTRSGGTTVLYRGAASIPAGVAAQGWTHIGDPDSAGGYVIDPYQNVSSGASAKMYRLTTPSGSSYEYTHPLASGELYNNSFDAISPDTRWLVSGDWNTQNRLYVYPAPYFNGQAGRTGGPLPLAGQIDLSTPVNDIQGCDFISPAQLICASDDSGETIFANPDPLLEITLSSALDTSALNAGTVTGTVTDLGSIPHSSVCSGTYEPEGVDYDPGSGTLRVEITQPGVCAADTTVYTYQRS
ncbi:MAG: hypothetical protein J2P26_02425 [Nocardiopsaceae bacterium]|nr:hypothetical protein [Nocardiopsaceae bacterium]